MGAEHRLQEKKRKVRYERRTCQWQDVSQRSLGSSHLNRVCVRVTVVPVVSRSWETKEINPGYAKSVAHGMFHHSSG